MDVRPRAREAGSLGTPSNISSGLKGGGEIAQTHLRLKNGGLESHSFRSHWVSRADDLLTWPAGPTDKWEPPPSQQSLERHLWPRTLRQNFQGCQAPINCLSSAESAKGQVIPQVTREGGTWSLSRPHNTTHDACDSGLGALYLLWFQLSQLGPLCNFSFKSNLGEKYINPWPIPSPL